MQSKKFILSICLFILTAFFITACSDSNSSSGGGSIEQKVTKVIMNDYTRYALFQDGSLFAWGSNQYGLLGSGSDTMNSEKPVYITENIKEIFADDNITYAVTYDNALYVWGYNEYGQTGTGSDAVYINIPTKVNGITGNIKDIYINGYATYALTDDNSLYVWGNNEHGQLGVNNTVEYVKTPTKLSGINGAVNKVYTGDSVYVITNDNAIYSFGSNEFWFEYVQYNGLLGRDGSNYEPLQVLFEK